MFRIDVFMNTGSSVCILIGYDEVRIEESEFFAFPERRTTVPRTPLKYSLVSRLRRKRMSSVLLKQWEFSSSTVVAEGLVVSVRACVRMSQ